MSSRGGEGIRPRTRADGARVEVEGHLQNGVLVAEEVKLRSGDVRIHAEIANAADVNPAAGTIVLLGITIRVDASTQIEDERDEVEPFGLADLAAGDFLEVRGVEEGPGSVLATEVERDETDDVRLRGRLEAFEPSLPQRSLTILGVLVPTDGFTQFEGFATPTAFYSAVMLGDVVDVDDLQDGDETAIDVADKVEIDDGSED